jgi:putative FmdB family regulatory protein
MPIYEYRCAACGHQLEALQKMSESPLRKCPECGKSQLRRLVSASRFRLKGSGWYETDFKGDSEKKRNLVEKAGVEPSASAAKSEPSTDSASKDAATKDSAATAPAADKAASPASESGKSQSTAKRATSKKSKPKPKAKPARR